MRYSSNLKFDLFCRSSSSPTGAARAAMVGSGSLLTGRQYQGTRGIEDELEMAVGKGALDGSPSINAANSVKEQALAGQLKDPLEPVWRY